jgi:hypothetical protein
MFDMKEYMGKYHQEHKDKQREYMIIYRKNHQDEIKAYKKRYNKKHKEENRILQRKYGRLLNFQTKFDAILYYSNGTMRCALCDENDIDVLCIDHTDNNGNEHRREINGYRIYNWLRKNKYPKGFRVLCFNCNNREKMKFVRSKCL